jgi:uncharacterized protein
MKSDMPIRPIESGPLSDREIEELNAFLLAEDGLENPMDFYTFDGFICAVLSGPNVIMPSEWLRWVWDEEDGEQTPEFSTKKQAARILSLLIGHANVLAFTLIHGPQYYEPLFYSHNVEGNSVPIIDEWCCGYVKGIALDPKSWRPLFDARPDTKHRSLDHSNFLTIRGLHHQYLLCASLDRARYEVRSRSDLSATRKRAASPPVTTR